MDDAQLIRLYHEATMYHVNPPSFETWKRALEEAIAVSQLFPGVDIDKVHKHYDRFGPKGV